MNRIIIFLMLLFYIISINESTGVAEDINKKVHTIILNTSLKKPRLNNTWLETLSVQKVTKWGKARGLFLVPDGGPIVDGLAIFISKHGSEIKVTNLKECNYRLWIDFVIFNKSSSFHVPSRLKIFIDNKLVKIIKFANISRTNNPYMIEIPYNLSVDGTIVLKFKEQSSVEGFWGIWDIIISNSYKIPAVSHLNSREKNDMTVKDRIILPEKNPKKKHKPIRDIQKKHSTDSKNK